MIDQSSTDTPAAQMAPQNKPFNQSSQSRASKLTPTPTTLPPEGLQPIRRSWLDSEGSASQTALNRLITPQTPSSLHLFNIGCFIFSLRVRHQRRGKEDQDRKRKKSCLWGIQHSNNYISSRDLPFQGRVRRTCLLPSLQIR